MSRWASVPLLMLFLTAFPVGANAADKNFALLVGVSKYEHSGLSALQYPEDDAKALGELLKAGGYEVEVLLGKAATREAISKKLEALGQKSHADGVVLLGLFGHGVEIESAGSKEGCFCPYNTAMRVVKDFKGKEVLGADKKPLTEPDPASLVKLSSVMTTFNICKAGHRVLLADCCRVVPNQARGRSFGSGFKAADLPENTSVLFGCSPNEQAFEHPNWKHGAFTKSLLEQLPLLAGEGEVTTGTLADRLRKQVPGLVKEVSPRDSQTPKLFSTDSVDLQLGSIAEKSNTVIAKSPSGSKSRMAKDDVPPQEPASGESMTESFSEDFRSAADKELPDGWVNLDEKQLLLVRQDSGRPHLRTKLAAYEWDEQGVLGEERPSKVRLPPVSIEGDFQIELTVLSNETWSSPRSMALSLKGQDNETLTLRCFEDSSGFVAVLPGAEESKPFSLSGKTPYRLRLERKEGVYRVVNNSKTLLTHEANDNQEFHVVELELSPKMMVGSIKIGPAGAAGTKGSTSEK
jgi:uncharacterized caspase-like protein